MNKLAIVLSVSSSEETVTSEISVVVHSHLVCDVMLPSDLLRPVNPKTKIDP